MFTFFFSIDKIVATTFPFFVIDNIVFSITFESSRFYKMESNAPPNEQFGKAFWIQDLMGEDTI
jgi:hypothetical protein